MTDAHPAETVESGEPEFDLAGYLQIARRRYPLFLVAFVLVFGVAYWVSITLPSVYQASATILVQSQQIPSALARSTVTANADERIQVIQQRLMTRDNLLAIARKYNLYADQPALSPTDVVNFAKQSTAIQQIDVGNRVGPNASAIGFTVSFKNENAIAAANVANELVTSILQQNVQSRTVQASETAKFFNDQISQLQKDLAAKEAEIADFKNKNADSLPETFSSRQALLVQLQGQSADLRSRVSTLQSQRQLLVAQDNSPGSAGPGASSPEAQLAQLQSQLVQLRALYSDTHPEVKSVLARIDALQKAIKSSATNGPSTAAAPVPSTTAANAAAAASGNAAATTSDVAGVNSGRIADIDNQVAALTTQLADTDKRAAALDASLQKTPQVELALNVLTRDYQTLQSQYGGAQQKAADASTGQQLEQNQQAERFEVLEQATVPAVPIAPDRKKILLAGGFGAIVAGIAMVALLEFLTQSIRTSGDLERRLHMRPIVSIPYVTTTAERRRDRFRRVALPAAMALLLMIGLGAVQIYYLPLDLVAHKLIDRLK